MTEDRTIASRFGWLTRSALVCIGLYLAFFLWYTPLRGPLSAEEIDHYVELLTRAGSESGSEPERAQRLRKFLEEDTGGDFVMVNAIEFRDPPLQVEGVESADDAPAVLAKYMEYMFPALFKRASHPVLFGSAAGPAMDLWGLENGRSWSQGAAMRYRSRRDLMEIATNPAFAGRHEFKIAAMEKTVAFPIDPWFHLGDPRLLGGLLLLSVLLGLRMQALTARLRRMGEPSP